MRICLNPDHPHSGREPTPTQLVCVEPMCGFLLAGAIIKHWQVTSLFASGSIADLYMAVNMDGSASGPSKMVVKVLRAPTAEPASQLEQKLALLLSLRHQHINPLMSVGWTASPGSLYFLSPFAEQGSLLHYPITTAPLSPLAIAGIVRQIAESLNYAHEHQVVHGRLKLENCLVPSPGIVQVSDFFYCLLNEAERYANPSIVAPEQFYGQAEAASDQYTLALLAYQLLVGQLPFAESGPRARLAMQEQSLMRPVTQFRRDVSALVDQTLGRALSRQPQDRFPNITAFALDFQAALDTNTNVPSAAFSRVVTPLPAALDSAGPQSTPAQLRYSSPGRLLPLCVLPGHTSAATLLRWAPDGIHLASASGDDQSIHIWSVQYRVGTPLASLTGHSDNVLALSWSPDGAALVSGSVDATLRTWILAQSTVQTAWWGHDGSVAVVDWSPNGTYIASGGSDRTIRLWDRLGNAVSVWQAHGRGGVTALAWSPDGRTLASGGADHLIHLWDMTNRTILATLDGHTDEIRYLVWSPNGGLLASYAGKKDLRIGLWNRQTYELAAMLGGHSREIVGLLWSSDGAWLASASADATLRFWDTHRRLGEPIGLLVKLESSPLSMAGAPKSGMIAVSLADMLIQVLQLQIIN